MLENWRPIIREEKAQATQSNSTGPTESESKQLCEYTTRTKIGDGGFGVVFKAQHKIDKRWYAIKQVDPIDTEESPNKVLREVHILAELEHPHIVRYYGAWLERPPPGEKLPRMVDDNLLCLYIRMEWCDGSTLHEWLGQNQRPEQRPTKQTLGWFSQLVSAIKYIHDQGLIHRDIKSGNIFFGSSRNGAASVLKIGDLGLAVDVTPSSSSGADGNFTASSRHTQNAGTPSYMSPEQQSGNYKNGTDIFSLGLVFLEMVHPLKTDAERCAVFGALRAKQRPAVMNKLNKKMDALISWMTAFEPEKRATSSELDNELKKMTVEQLLESAKGIGVGPHAETNDGTDSNVKSEAGTSSLAAIAAVDGVGSSVSKCLRPDSSSEVRTSCSGTSTVPSSEHSDDGVLEGINFTELLPPKLTLQIFGYLHEGDLTRCSLVSRKFWAVANHQILWKSLYQEVFEYSLPLLHVGHGQFEFREPHDWPQPQSDESIVVNPWKESFKQLKDGIHVRLGYASLYSGFGAGGRRLTQCNSLDQALRLVNKARGKNAEKLIFLHTGLYISRTTVTINSDIQIIGASAGPDIASQVTIEGRHTTTVTLAKGSQGAYLGWMTVRFATDPKAVIDVGNLPMHMYHFALQICDDSTALVEHCIIHSSVAFGTTVCVKGSAANPTMRHCVVCDCEGGGIYVTDAAQGQFEDCEIARNNDSGVEVGNRANPFFRRCHIHDGRSSGIFTFDHGMGYFESCNIHNNRLHEIGVKNAANPTVMRCEVHHGQQSGIHVHEKGRGQFMENRIHSNAFFGIAIESHSDSRIARNKVQDNQRGGVIIRNNGQGVLEENEIFDNAMYGVWIETDGNPTLRRNKIYDGRDEGVYISDKGRGVLEDNDIYRNAGAGVVISSELNPTLRRNRVYEGRAAGIEITNGAMATLESNAIFHNRFGGLSLAADVRLTLRDNKIYDNDDLVEKTVAKGGCLFEITSDTSLAMHDIYCCDTCDTTEEDTICLSCARTCHTGHAVHLVRHSSFFCDCGAGLLKHQCRLLSKARRAFFFSSISIHELQVHDNDSALSSLDAELE